ncbi:A24 family peptidase [Symmachiella macrocystis]|uniref:A24 family peptidase n=1 Tax=Symmachiella macrocystis TaxID=2527985 RepID=UPI0018D49FA8|nr:A24 family peptidase [Symmachiella macrocystis]
MHRYLLGQYLAMVLMVSASFVAAVWATWDWQSPVGTIAPLVSVWIICRAAGLFSGQWFAPLITAASAFAVLAVRDVHVVEPLAEPIVFAPIALLVMLALIFAIDVVESAQSLSWIHVASRLRRQNWLRLAVWGLGAGIVLYVVAMPVGDWIIDQIYPPKSGRILEDMTLGQQVRFRGFEVFCALVFCVFGATIGSFLNVVAYRLPRRESVVFKSSHCPKCGVKIESRDNVPIIGWLRLGGRCRACQSLISMRYPIVESISAAFFLVMYFVELISGGANIPVRHPNIYHGPLWIIFYPKWDLIGLYLYHCFAFCILLVYALIDIDRQRLSTRVKCCIASALILPPMIWQHLLPTLSLSFASSLFQNASLQAGVTCLTGCLVGMALGWLTAWGIYSTAEEDEYSSSRAQFAGCLSVVGISLGWQAVVAVTLCTLLLMFGATLFARWQHWPLPQLSPLLLAAFVLQLCLWRWTTQHPSNWWPSDRMLASGWAAIAVGYVVLLLANRLAVRQRQQQWVGHGL